MLNSPLNTVQYVFKYSFCPFNGSAFMILVPCKSTTLKSGHAVPVRGFEPCYIMKQHYYSTCCTRILSIGSAPGLLNSIDTKKYCSLPVHIVCTHRPVTSCVRNAYRLLCEMHITSEKRTPISPNVGSFRAQGMSAIKISLSS